MSKQINKPYVLKAAEKIYFNVCKIKNENQLDNKKAIESFIKTDHYEKLCTGDFHNEWLNLIKDNKNIDKINNQQELEQVLKKLMDHITAGNVTGGSLALTNALGTGPASTIKKQFGIKESIDPRSSLYERMEKFINKN